jgi:drug/metabolite transporter superfamily protein YnfA
MWLILMDRVSPSPMDWISVAVSLFVMIIIVRERCAG